MKLPTNFFELLSFTIGTVVFVWGAIKGWKEYVDYMREKLKTRQVTIEQVTNLVSLVKDLNHKTDSVSEGLETHKAQSRETLLEMKQDITKLTDYLMDLLLPNHKKN